MRIFRNISLKPYNSFGLDYKANTLIRIKTEKEAKVLFRNGVYWRKPMLIIGGGSNLLFTGDHKGTILYPGFGSIRLESEDHNNLIVSAGAGIVWDRLVEWSVSNGLSGLENLSGIPGNVGAVPVQNIGAYGVEAKDVIHKVRTIRAADGKVRIFSPEECGFGYRTSIFKTTEKSGYLVTRVYFRLSRKFFPVLEYGALKKALGGLNDLTAKDVRDSVLKIRSERLPDPSVLGNAGSFFKNPVVSRSAAEALINSFPGMPMYEEPEGCRKIAAGWLAEQCGWKGKRYGNAGVHEKQALVLVNHGNASGKEIFKMSEEIRISVKSKFGILLEREVEVI